LKQYLVDIALIAIAEYHAKANGSDVSEELGTLYFNRMLRFTGVKTYDSQVAKILKETTPQKDQALLESAA
jgi:hypothetical protein